MSYTRRLVFTAEAEHRVESECAAEPLGFDRKHFDSKRMRLNGFIIRPLAEDSAYFALGSDKSSIFLLNFISAARRLTLSQLSAAALVCFSVHIFGSDSREAVQMRCGISEGVRSEG